MQGLGKRLGALSAATAHTANKTSKNLSGRGGAVTVRKLKGKKKEARGPCNGSSGDRFKKTGDRA